MSNWDIRISGPNGSESHFTWDDESAAQFDDPDAVMVEHIRKVVDQMRQHPQPLELPQGTPAALQPMKQAKGKE